MFFFSLLNLCSFVCVLFLFVIIFFIYCTVFLFLSNFLFVIKRIFRVLFNYADYQHG